jgi:hypothetical protein
LFGWRVGWGVASWVLVATRAFRKDKRAGEGPLRCWLHPIALSGALSDWAPMEACTRQGSPDTKNALSRRWGYGERKQKKRKCSRGDLNGALLGSWLASLLGGASRGERTTPNPVREVQPRSARSHAPAAHAEVLNQHGRRRQCQPGRAQDTRTQTQHHGLDAHPLGTPPRDIAPGRRRELAMLLPGRQPGARPAVLLRRGQPLLRRRLALHVEPALHQGVAGGLCLRARDLHGPVVEFYGVSGVLRGR